MGIRKTLLRQYLHVWRYRELILNLVVKDLKSTYCASALGLIWSFILPASMIAIYYCAFKYILNVAVENFILLLMTGIFNYNFFNTSAMSSTDAIMKNQALIMNVALPRIVFPISTIIYNLTILSLTLIVFFPVSLFLGTKIGLHLLFYPIILILYACFTFGVSMALCVLTVRYRDIRQIMELSLIGLVWLSPVFYDFTKIREYIRAYLYFNPLVPYLLSIQDIFFRSKIPDVNVLLMAFGWAVISVFVGGCIFLYFDPLLAEEI